MDFGALPPEVNSARMYAGPGAGPMLAAAAAWDGVAAQLHWTAASYTSVLSVLAAGWQGPSSAAMAAAIAPYAAWMSATAAQAEQTAVQARAAVAAYEAAFTATVPPPVVATNRAQLAALVATNIFGQNTPAIMATEAHYAEMWAQDAAALFGYAGSSATASQVTPFSPPPRTVDPAGTAAQAAAVAHANAASVAANAETPLPQLMSSVPQALQSLATPAAADPPSLLSELNAALTGPLGPTSLYGIGGSPYLLGIEGYLLPQNAANLTSAGERLDRDQSKLAPVGGGPGSGSRLLGSPGPAAGGASAGTGRAGLVGGMSVPPGWASAAPAIRPIAVVLPDTGLGAVPAALAADGQGSLLSNMALSGMAGRAVVDTRGAGTVGVGGGGIGTVATTATIILIPADDPE